MTDDLVVKGKVMGLSSSSVMSAWPYTTTDLTISATDTLRPTPAYALDTRASRIEDAARALIDNLIEMGTAPDDMGPLTRKLWEALNGVE